MPWSELYLHEHSMSNLAGAVTKPSKFMSLGGKKESDQLWMISWEISLRPQFPSDSCIFHGLNLT